MEHHSCQYSPTRKILNSREVKAANKTRTIMINDWSIFEVRTIRAHIREYMGIHIDIEKGAILFLKVINCLFITTENTHIMRKDDGANPRSCGRSSPSLQRLFRPPRNKMKGVEFIYESWPFFTSTRCFRNVEKNWAVINFCSENPPK